MPIGLSPSYSWAVGFASYSGPTLDISTLSLWPGDGVSCTATVVDSEGATDSASTSIVLENRAPTLYNMVISPSNVYIDSVLDCSASSLDGDGETLNESIEWEINGQSAGSGASLSLLAASASAGDIVECSITVTDGSGASSSLSTGVIVKNRDPVIDSFDLSPALITEVELELYRKCLRCGQRQSDIEF